MTPNDSPAANKTSEEVKRILGITVPSPIRCGVYASVPREVLEKYVRMDEALETLALRHERQCVKMNSAIGVFLPSCSCNAQIAKDARSFDPLND